MSEDQAGKRGVRRREALAGLLGGGLGALAPSGAAEAAAPPSAAPQSAAETAAAGWPPPILSDHQRETLAALADRILPGSREAEVAGFVDRLLAVGPAPPRSRLLEALSAFEAESLARHRRPFAKLGRDEQAALLDDAAEDERANRKRPVDWGWFDVPGGEGTPSGLGDHLALLKGWIARAYYSTERGARELGWTGVPIHDGFPGCTHGGHT